MDNQWLSYCQRYEQATPTDRKAMLDSLSEEQRTAFNAFWAEYSTLDIPLPPHQSQNEQTNRKRKSFFPKGCITAFVLIFFSIVIVQTFILLFDSSSSGQSPAQVREMQLAERQKDWNQNKEEHIATIESLIKTDPKMAIRDIRKWRRSADGALDDLYHQALKAYVINVPASKLQENYQIYTELLKMEPNNTKYKNKAAHYKAKIDKINAEKERKEQAKNREAQRQRAIESQFSSWDGSHYAFTKVIKKAMHDPSSYKHVETRYQVLSDRVRVFTTFRGTNGFGAVVTNTAAAEFTISGDYIRMIE